MAQGTARCPDCLHKRTLALVFGHAGTSGCCHAGSPHMHCARKQLLQTDHGTSFSRTLLFFVFLDYTSYHEVCQSRPPHPYHVGTPCRQPSGSCLFCNRISPPLRPLSPISPVPAPCRAPPGSGAGQSRRDLGAPQIIDRPVPPPAFRGRPCAAASSTSVRRGTSSRRNARSPRPVRGRMRGDFAVSFRETANPLHVEKLAGRHSLERGMNVHYTRCTNGNAGAPQ